MEKEHAVKLMCSFCGKSQREVRKLIAGPTVYICDECIKLCNDILAKEAERGDLPPDEAARRPTRKREADTSGRTLCCSFCGKSHQEVRKLIAGPSVYICDECIGLCNDIIAEEISREEIVAALEVKLSAPVRAFLAGILERGMPAAVRIRGVLNNRIIRYMTRRRALGEPPDELVFPPWNLASDWSGLHELLARAAPRKSESGDVRPLEVQLPAWVRPIAERLAGTLEVLDVLARSLDEPGLEMARHLVPSVDIAVRMLREAREMLLAGAPRTA